MLVFWILFNVFVIAMLALDLGVLHRGSRGVSLRAALAWSGAWIALAAAFAVAVLFWQGRHTAIQFLTGYIIELSLSIDNLFVFLIIFRFFKVPDQHQHKVLFWGILGALLIRGAFIVAGASLLQRFTWIVDVFGALLVFSGIKLLWQGSAKIQPEKNPLLRLFRGIFPVTEDYVGGNFFARRQKLYATPLLLVLLVVETTDIFFAIDSIPAVLAITTNAFIVYTSNVFALLGLRSMYVALAGVIDLFHYLHYGLSVVLIFIGLKMLGSHYVEIPAELALAIVSFILAVSILASLLYPARRSPPVT